jgi:hypothetical protein
LRMDFILKSVGHFLRLQGFLGLLLHHWRKITILNFLLRFSLVFLDDFRINSHSEGMVEVLLFQS